MVLMLGISIWQMQKIDTSVTLMTTESLNDERDANEWLAVIRESGIRTLAIINLDDARMQKVFQSEIAAESKRITPIRKRIEEKRDAGGRKGAHA